MCWFHKARLQISRDCHRCEHDCKHFYHHRPDKENVFPCYLALLSCSNSESKQLSQDVSEHAGLSQGWSFHHPQQCPKCWIFVNLVIIGNECDFKGLETAQVIREKRRQKNNAAPSPSKFTWQPGLTLCSAELDSEMKSCPVLLSLQTLQQVLCDAGQVTVTLSIFSEELDFKPSQASAKDRHAQVLKEDLIWNQVNLFLLPLPLKR